MKVKIEKYYLFDSRAGIFKFIDKSPLVLENKKILKPNHHVPNWDRPQFFKIIDEDFLGNQRDDRGEVMKYNCRIKDIHGEYNNAREFFFKANWLQNQIILFMFGKQWLQLNKNIWVTSSIAFIIMICTIITTVSTCNTEATFEGLNKNIDSLKNTTSYNRFSIDSVKLRIDSMIILSKTVVNKIHLVSPDSIEKTIKK